MEMNTLEFISAILAKLEESQELKNIRAKVLDDETKVPDDNYDMACRIFNETLSECFHLGAQTCLSLITDFIRIHERNKNIKKTDELA
jgi:hypothetical protein